MVQSHWVCGETQGGGGQHSQYTSQGMLTEVDPRSCVKKCPFIFLILSPCSASPSKQHPPQSSGSLHGAGRGPFPGAPGHAEMRKATEGDQRQGQGGASPGWRLPSPLLWLTSPQRSALPWIGQGGRTPGFRRRRSRAAAGKPDRRTPV